MKKTQTTVFQLVTAAILITYGTANAKDQISFNLFDHTLSIKQQGGLIMSQNNVGNETGVWDKTKDVSKDAWDATKDGTAKAWDKTKEVSEDAWDATKDGTAKAWDKTKEVSKDAWDATKNGAEKAKDAVTGDD